MFELESTAASGSARQYLPRGSRPVQASATVAIPKEHHRFVIGKNGEKLQDLELKTATKIQIPRPEDASNHIRITGTREGIEKARHEVLLISAEQDRRAVERLEVEKAFHPFIAGPYNRLVGEIMQETGTRINIPPPSVNRTEIVFTGEKEQLAQAVARVRKIYEEKVAAAGASAGRGQSAVGTPPRALSLGGVRGAGWGSPAPPSLPGRLGVGSWREGVTLMSETPHRGQRTWCFQLLQALCDGSGLDLNSQLVLLRRKPQRAFVDFLGVGRSRSSRPRPSGCGPGPCPAPSGPAL